MLRKLLLGSGSIFIVTVFNVMNASAQFNDSTHHYIYYNSTGNINRTNGSKATLLSNLLKFSILKKTMSLNSINSYVYGKSNGLESNSDFSSSLDFDVWKPNQKIYYWGLGTFDKSFSLKINHRIQGGVGIGYTVVSSKSMSIVISDGILYERSDLTDAELGRLNYNVFRNSLRVKYHWNINNIMVLDGNAFYQPALSSVHDVIWKEQTTLSVKLKKWLSFNTSVTYNRISRVETENLLVTFGVILERYF